MTPSQAANQGPGVMDEMEVAHRKDYDDLHRMDDLRRAIHVLLDDPPSRCSPRTRAELEEAAGSLAVDAARVVRAWD